MTHSRIDLRTYITITLWFGCNNDCTLCMLRGLKSKLTPITFLRFQEILSSICEEGVYENLILSGAEVTTFDELPRYVRYAASLNSFKKIQIQTNGRRLADFDYARHLVDCGVNEFFVSIHGLRQTHEAITRRRGSFEQTWAGLNNLSYCDVNTISNTVLTTRNYDDLLPLMRRLHRQNLSETHVWSLFPMQECDRDDHLLSLSRIINVFPALQAVGTVSNIPIVLKNVPLCLPAKPPVYNDSLLAETIIPETYWRAFARNQFGLCLYRKEGICQSKHCWGLSQAHVRKFGFEQNLLTPIQDSP